MLTVLELALNTVNIEVSTIPFDLNSYFCMKVLVEHYFGFLRIIQAINFLSGTPSAR